jgi:hypothetical protein
MINFKAIFLYTKKLPIDIWFFFGFLLTFCFSVRKVTLYFPIEGAFNEYTGLYIYVSEIFLILAIGSWLLISLSYKLTNMSNSEREKGSFRSILAYIKQKASFVFLDKHNLIHSLSWLLPLFLVMLSFFSIFWASNQIVASYRSFKLLELYGLYLYIIYGLYGRFFVSRSDYRENVVQPEAQFGELNESSNVPRGTIHYLSYKNYVTVIKPAVTPGSPAGGLGTIHSLDKISSQNITKSIVPPASPAGGRGTIEMILENLRIMFGIIILLGVLQSIVAIGQFLIQESLGIRFLRESIISPQMDGVAKIILDGEKYVRAYGFAPHPNILGGFLLFSIVITWLYLKLFNIQSNCSTWNNFFGKQTWIKSNSSNCSTCLAGRQAWNNFFLDSSIRLTWLEFGRGLKGLIAPSYILSKMWLFEKKWLVKAIIILQILALLTTFSKSAIIGLFIAGAYVFFRNPLFLAERRKNSSKEQPEIVPPASLADKRGTNNFENITNNINTHETIVPRGTISIADDTLAGKPCLPAGGRGTVGKIKDLATDYLGMFRFSRSVANIRHLRIITLICMITVVSGYILLKPDLNSLFFKSLGERAFYLNVSYETILDSPFLGVGAGQFVLRMVDFSENVILPWEYQPIHNVFLLIWAELGIFGLGLFLWWMMIIFGKNKNPNATALSDSINYNKNEENKGFSIVPRGTIAEDIILENKKEYLSMRIILTHLKGIMLGFLFIALFDHYLWDIWQGQVMFWLVTGMMVGIKSKI